MKYNPSDAAKACNVSVNTIRGWIRDHAAHFTPGARGESGNSVLSDKDLNTLKYIAQLRAEGLLKDAIGVRLQEVAIGDTEDACRRAGGFNGDADAHSALAICTRKPSGSASGNQGCVGIP